jgi:RND family efflux transporter MFP subunit
MIVPVEIRAIDTCRKRVGMRQLLRGVVWLILATAIAAPLGAQQAGTQGKKVTDTIPGVVVAARSWDVTPKVSNLIERLHFTEGQVVREGDLLVEMIDGFKLLEVELAQAAKERAAIVLEDAQDDLDRQEKLKAREAVSVKSYRDAFFAVEAAKAALKIADVELRIASAILDAQEIYAPIDGRITAPRYRENAYVDLTEGTEIATIVQLDPINVRVPISIESLLTRLRANEYDLKYAKQLSVELKLTDGLVFPQTGQIVSTGVGVDTETGQGTILVSFPNPRGILRPGLKVLVTGYLK